MILILEETDLLNGCREKRFEDVELCDFFLSHGTAYRASLIIYEGRKPGIYKVLKSRSNADYYTGKSLYEQLTSKEYLKHHASTPSGVWFKVKESDIILKYNYGSLGIQFMTSRGMWLSFDEVLDSLSLDISKKLLFDIDLFHKCNKSGRK